MTVQEALDAFFEDAVWPVGLPDHFSATQTNTARRCLETYRRVYVQGHRTPPASAMLWGGADHAAIAWNLSQKVRTHVDLPVDEVQDAFCDSLDAKVDEAGGPSEVVWDDSYADIKDRGTQLVAVYHNQVAPALQPLSVESDFSLPVEGVPVPVVGFIDVETEGRVIERKTSKRREKAPKADWLLQGKIYQLAAKKPVEWHISVKTKPAVVTPDHEEGLAASFSDPALSLAQRQLTQAAARVVWAMSKFGPESPWPDATDHPWACNYCGFRPTCPWWAS